MILFARSHFSLMQSVLSPRDICILAKKFGYEAICIADVNNFYGLPATLREAKKRDLKVLIAITLKDDSFESISVAINHEGYKNLCTLITKVHCEKKSILDLTEYFGGLVFFSRCIETSLFLRMKEFKVYWKCDLPLLLMPRGIIERDIPPMAVHDICAYQQQDCETLCLMDSVSRNELLCEQVSFPINIFKKPDELEIFFSPNLYAMENHRLFLESYQYIYPYEVKFPNYVTPNNTSPVDFLRGLVYEGAKKRYQKLDEIVCKRIEYELGIISDKGFAAYFLVTWEIVNQATRTCGRGSGSASVVSYCLFITNIDPIRYNLLFERFLEPERVDYPDLDIDFAWDERDDILEYVFDHFGRDRTAMVCNHICFKTRMAFRVSAKAHGIAEDKIEGLSHKVRRIFKKSTHELSELDEKVIEITQLALKLISKPRCISVHCGGVVICSTPIATIVPVQIATKGVPIIQWEKDGAEEMGLIKLDLLGNRSLAVIRDAIINLKKQGIELDFHKVDPTLDMETIKLLENGDSIGVFYIESPATRLLQRRTRKGDFDHVVIHSSLIRPASNKSIQEYTRRVLGKKWEPLEVTFEKITSDTYGILVYEDQVLKVSHDLAGFSYREANVLRKALSREDGSALKVLKKNFFRGVELAGSAGSLPA
ncbi:MAG: hypothetical protein COA79_14565 [Planctomycetota bacterium]|nr:MAG: hypothetical protein COA79_14565 [Planctomycetota bacterium]